MKSLPRSTLFFALLIFFSFSAEGAGLYDGNSAAEGRTHSWNIFPSPTNNRLDQIIMFSPDNGIIGGRYLLKFNGNSWSLFKSPPPSLMATKIFANNENNIWVTYNTYSSTSGLFSYKHGKWNEEENPFANTITAVNLAGNDIDWIGGDREIAYKKNNKWIFIPFPECLGPITYIYPAGNKKIWTATNDYKLFYYDGKKWTRHFNDTKIKYVRFYSPEKGFFLSDDTLYEYRSGAIRIHSVNPVFKNIFKMEFLDNGEIWAIGNDALLMHYFKKKWEKVAVPTFEDLLDICMVSPNDGWITGSNGLIMHYSKTSSRSGLHTSAGFNPVKTISVSKTINDEYGIAMADFNNDGLLDIYAVCIFEPNRLYINKSEYNAAGKIKFPVFTEEAAYRKISGISEDSRNNNFSDLDLGIGAADIDNDGDQDIYLCSLLGPNKLFLNNGSGFFRNVSGQIGRGTGSNERTNSAVWGDVDNDGDVDLFITNEYSTNRLYLNDGNGYFTERTYEAGLQSASGGMCASFTDIDNDGDLDLCVVNWAKPNLLYKNTSNPKDGVKFINISDDAGFNNDFYSKSNAVCFADIDNDGDQDMFITKRKQSNRLYLNNGNGKFQDVTESYLGIDSMLSYGASFADFDQDGFLDLYIANVGDNVLYRNIGGRRFEKFSGAYELKISGYNTGTASGDIDNDGDIDIYSANYINGTSELLINALNNSRYIKFKISGTRSNRDGIGVKIYLYRHGSDSLTGFREVSGGSGYASSNSKEVHFGLPSEGKYDAVVYFPASGIKRNLNNLSSGKTYRVSEETEFKRAATLTEKFIIRTAGDIEIQTEVVKLVFVLLILTLSFFRGRKRFGWDNLRQLIFNGSVLLLFIVQIVFFFDKGFLFSSILPVSSVVIMMLLLHLSFERVVMKRIHEEEKKSTRDRIARDLHDDLASTLSSSVIYLEALKNSVNDKSVKDAGLFKKINWLLLQASDAVTDIVWTVSPAHDKLEDLVMRLREFLSDYCKSNGIEYATEISTGGRVLQVSEDVKRNTYLIFKEALNNIIKHSKATFVIFSVSYSRNSIEISLEDNGIGISASQLSREKSPVHGHGLDNMKKRAGEINSEIKIISGEEVKGTKITLVIKMT